MNSPSRLLPSGLDRALSMPCLALVGMGLLGTSCSLMPTAADDTNDPLTEVNHARAVVVIAEDAFSSSSATGDITTTSRDSNGEVRTHTVNWNFLGSKSFDRDKAGILEQYFTKALRESRAFTVIDRDVIAEKRLDRELEIEGIQDAASDRKLLRPDLKLVACLTKLEEDASGTSQSVGATSWYSGIFSWVTGLFSRSTQRAECEISVTVIDRETGEVLSAVDGKAFAIGVENAEQAGGVLGRVFGAGSSTSYDNPDLEAAMARAVIRAVNKLIDDIPKSYFYHVPGGGPRRTLPSEPTGITAEAPLAAGSGGG